MARDRAVQSAPDLVTTPMPVTYAFDDQIIVVRAEGLYSVVEFEDAVLAALTDAAGPASAVLLVDISASNTLRDRATEDLRGTARFLARHRHRFGSRVAVVAPSDLAFGLMRMAAVTVEAGGVAAEVYRELAPARAWLRGEGPPALERVEPTRADAVAPAAKAAVPTAAASSSPLSTPLAAAESR